MSIKDFVASMSKVSGQEPRYMFDVNTFEACPGILAGVTIPGHISTTFMHQWAGDYNECQLGHFNLFLTESGFQTNMHNDHQHYSFVASMCEGRKRWRIVTNKELAAHASHMNVKGGTMQDGHIVLADIRQPFETWTTDSLLNKIDLEVQEGILEPGDMLYIPPGAPHAAETLDDSLMFASNDGSFGSMDILKKLCLTTKSPNLKGYCAQEYHQVLHEQMISNFKRFNKTVPREPKSFFQAFRCRGGRYCDALKEHFIDEEPDSETSLFLSRYCTKHEAKRRAEL